MTTCLQLDHGFLEQLLFLGFLFSIFSILNIAGYNHLTQPAKPVFQVTSKTMFINWVWG